MSALSANQIALNGSSIKRQFVAGLCALLSLAVVLAPLWWQPSVTPPTENVLTMRKISVVKPPPPPPPPTQQSNQQEASVSIQVQGTGPALPMLEVTPNIDIHLPSPPEINFQPSQWQSLEIDWQAFDLKSLDALPTLVHATKPNFPATLSARGVKKATVKLDIFIDEQGHITLIEILENPYPELKQAIYQFVQGSRFSAPIKDGKPVRARFVLPLEIKP